MSCSHCSGVITKALKQLDPQAEIGFDMHHRMIQVETTSTPIAVVDALDKAKLSGHTRLLTGSAACRPYAWF
ncbi:heavy-metal-associated domain-containing protein [Massilia sp. H-1]|nr:heavy-metal-associated domain-containing protein [Massilia sp. H-1]